MRVLFVGGTGNISSACTDEALRRGCRWRFGARAAAIVCGNCSGRGGCMLHSVGNGKGEGSGKASGVVVPLVNAAGRAEFRGLCRAFYPLT